MSLGSQAPQNTILHYLAKILIPTSNASLKIFLETLLTYALSKGGDFHRSMSLISLSLIISTGWLLDSKGFLFFPLPNSLAVNREGLSPLHEAAIKGNVEVISFFLNQGANPNTKSRNGETPLHFAVVSSNEEAVKVLLAKGADPDAPAERGTPREISKKLRLPNIDKLLSAVPVKSHSTESSGGSGFGSSVAPKAPSMGFSPPPDVPPPPPPPADGGDDAPGDRASYALDETALNDLITKISDPAPVSVHAGERASKPLPPPPNKNKTPSGLPPQPTMESPRTNGKEELNDLLDELDFGVRDRYYYYYLCQTHFSALLLFTYVLYLRLCITGE